MGESPAAAAKKGLEASREGGRTPGKPAAAAAAAKRACSPAGSPGGAGKPGGYAPSGISRGCPPRTSRPERMMGLVSVALVALTEVDDAVAVADDDVFGVLLSLLLFGGLTLPLRAAGEAVDGLLSPDAAEVDAGLNEELPEDKILGSVLDLPPTVSVTLISAELDRLLSPSEPSFNLPRMEGDTLSLPFSLELPLLLLRLRPPEVEDNLRPTLGLSAPI